MWRQTLSLAFFILVKKKKTRTKIDLPDEEEYLGSLLGEKRDRDKKEDDRIIYGADPIPKQDQIDIFDLKNKD